ncbi:hypothetical protein ACV1CZ_22150, partial [Aeromonas caviae]
MLSVLNNRTYRHLFTAQVIALVGTGLMTVALGLLGVASENGIYGHSRFCNTDFDDKLACLNL